MEQGILARSLAVWQSIFRLADTFILLLALVVGFYFKFQSFYLPERYVLGISWIVFVSWPIFSAVGLYKIWRGQSIFREMRLVFFAVLLLTFVMASTAFLTKTGETFSRLWFCGSLFSAFIVMSAFRLFMRKLINFLRSRGWNQKNIVIIGAGETGLKVARRLKAEAWAGLNIVAFFDDAKPDIGDEVDTPIVGKLDDLPEFINQCSENSENKIDQVWIALPLAAEKEIRSIYTTLQETSVSVMFVPDMFGFALLNHSVDNIAGMSVVNMSVSKIAGLDRIAKRVLDLAVAIISLVLVSPLMLIIAILIKLDSSGSVFYRQIRYGYYDEKIEVFKFRSMKECAHIEEVCIQESTSGVVVHGMRNDPRITRIGKFIRRTSIDELPQLFNVLLGDMSIVGPRPHPVQLDAEYRNISSRYARRHIMKPGITGWAQVNGWRGNTSIKKRVEFDLEYIANWSLWFDFKIMLLTLYKGITNSNAY